MDIDKIVKVLEFIQTRSVFIDPIMFQEITSSLSVDASDSERMEQSIRKSEQLPKALQQSSETIGNFLTEIEEVELAIASLKNDMIAEKERLEDLINTIT